jgi:hypothetical protein
MTDDDDREPGSPHHDLEPSEHGAPGPVGPEDDASSSPPSGSVMIGPFLGVIIGFLVFRLLPEDTPILLGLAIALVAIAATTYASIEISRRRAKRG